jgi:hypothetical protein
VTPAQIAQLQKLVDAGTLSDSLARQALDGVLAGEGDPQQVVAARGLEVVSDDAALGAAVDRAIAANPSRGQDPRRQVSAAGALIGAVMKEMRGQADAPGSGSSCWNGSRGVGGRPRHRGVRSYRSPRRDRSCGAWTGSPGCARGDRDTSRPDGTGRAGAQGRGAVAVVVAARAARSAGERVRDVAVGCSLAVVAAAAVAALGITGAGRAVPVGAIFSGADRPGQRPDPVGCAGTHGPRRALFRRLFGALARGVGRRAALQRRRRRRRPLTFPGRATRSRCSRRRSRWSRPRRARRAPPARTPGCGSASTRPCSASGRAADLAPRLRRAHPAGSFTLTDAVRLVVAFADISIISLGFLTYIRDFDRNLLLVWVGAVCYAAGDLITLHAALCTRPVAVAGRRPVVPGVAADRGRPAAVRAAGGAGRPREHGHRPGRARRDGDDDGEPAAAA